MFHCRFLIVCSVARRVRPCSGELVDMGSSEVPSRDSVLKEDIQLSVGSSLGFGNSEVGPDEAKEAEAGPKESSFATPVQGIGVEEVGHDDCVDDTKDVVNDSRDDNSLCTESSGGNFGDYTWNLTDKRRILASPHNLPRL